MLLQAQATNANICISHPPFSTHREAHPDSRSWTVPCIWHGAEGTPAVRRELVPVDSILLGRAAFPSGAGCQVAPVMYTKKAAGEHTC